MGYGKPQMTSLIIHSSLLLSFLVTVTNSANGQYRWRTDNWSECEKQYGCGAGGNQHRNVWCEQLYPTVRVVPDHLCKDAGYEPYKVQSCYKMCDPIGDYQVKWVTGMWSECQVDSQEEECARNLGFQTRVVYCAYTSTGERTEDSVCASFMQNKPPTRQPCEYNCPQNCVVGEFSKWSSCDECQSLNRSRTRSIIVPNNSGGKPCPAFSEMSPCSNCTDKYFLSFTPWTSCQAFSDSFNTRIPYNPHIGNQERFFDCYNIRGQKEELSKCTGKFQPIAYQQSCIIGQDCILGPWQGLTTINQTCVTENLQVKSGYLYKKRDVIQIPLGDGKPCGPLEEYTPIQSSQELNCPRTQWIMSDWSECKPIQGHQQCNTGIQERHIICVQIDQYGKQTPVDESECSPDKRPLTSQTCPTQCKTDCTVSVWSRWSECKVTDCEMYARRRRNNKKTGQRYRTRQIRTEPVQGGQVCPHLSETQNCDPEPCYTWKVSRGECLPQIPPCGVGVAYQSVYCFNRNNTRVSDRSCLELMEQPPNEVQCVVSCEDDCVVSEWSDWSECPKICQNNMMPGPTLKQRTRTILAQASGQVNCQAPLREQGNCPTVIECDTYMWQTEPWGRCELDNPSRGCGRGVQSRALGCYSNRTSVSDIKCAMEVKPSARQVCVVPCPENCKVSVWSAWSECSATCTSANTAANPSKSRQRYILIHPKNGGALCPNLLKEIKVCFDLPVCNQYQWNKTEWSECILHRKEKCGRGLKARNVTCQQNDGTVSPIGNCLTSVGQMPAVAEPCYVACEDECLFTDWTAWSDCLQGCGSKRFRQRRPKVGGNAPPECSDLKRYPRYEQDVCLCDRITQELPADFSECILDPPKSPSGLLRPISSSKRENREPSKDEGVICGWGQKIRYVACQTSSVATSLRRCTEAVSLEVKHCNIPCPNDCKMAEWSSWSKCPSKCRPGIQKRSRYIEQLNSAGGRQCPSLDSTQTETQTRLCHPECSQYIWKAYEWSMCNSNSHTCGDGTQQRVVHCVTINVNGDTTGITTEENCAGQVKPHSEQPCRMACIGECVMSDWTEWTDCPRPCLNSMYRQSRSRKIMRHASMYHSRCGETEQYKDCVKDINCVDYHWEWMPWTSCLINNGQDDCGVGLQERFPVCRTHNEEDVDDRICNKIIGPPDQSERMKRCEVPCDVDCLVSEWSQWSTCSQTCGLGKSTRERVIVEQYTGNGRKCPSDLVQSKPCYPKGCYRWNISDWSPCMPQKFMCGAGVQTRNVSCLGDDGLPADPEKCPPDLDILVLKSEQKCKVLCPWECAYTEWSEWSKCFINCADYAIGTTLGRTSRSRAIISQSRLQPCNEKLWEAKACPAMECTEFVWVASPWYEDMREVSCQTTYGIRVNEAACVESARPPTVLSCDPPCTGPQMICNDTNICGCEPDFTPVTNALGLVVACIMQNDTLQTGAQKTEEEEIVTNYWMYAVVAAGTLFIVFVALALYHMSDFFKNGPRPHGDQKEEKKSVDIESTDTSTRVSRQGKENCNVCSQIPAPVDTMVTTSNGRAEIQLVDDVGPYVRSWNRKSFANRFAHALSCLIPCMSKKPSYALHVHEKINETSVKVPLENIRLINHEGDSLKDESIETEFNDMSNLVHTPSYYMAVNTFDMENHRSSKVITLPRDTDNYQCDSLDTETSSPDSTKSQVKRSQSDSAISIPTSNSQGACSRTNSPSVKKGKMLKKRSTKSSDYSKSAKHSSTQTSTQSSVDELVELGTKPTNLTYQDSNETQAFPSSSGFPVEGSMSNFMDDYLEKMNSMSKSDENTNKSEDFLQHEEISVGDDQLLEPEVQSLSSDGSSHQGREESEDLLGNSQEQAELQQLLPEDQDSTVSNKGYSIFVPNSENREETKLLEKRPEIKRSDTAQRRERLSRQKKIDQEKDPSESDHNSNVFPDRSHESNSPKCNSHHSVNSIHGNDDGTQPVEDLVKKSNTPKYTSSSQGVESQKSSHKITPV
ncbi:thrombospondin type-1 domain-containing protein 7A-like [Saccostrea echinata]|uniref:thrombospondin type-1 domain-containing protein 7A-like n=1 Tax=Saccostrea echinata TaxID=191078 RepID=UPI002A7F873E|nr:thrombospondin type-1 domain-containing protein 7A-like [Saccostrea echinata]XP_061179708.1 thrombospondin type-1 domain-containing protein 7A-like [Saccostrea echinata]